MASDRRLAGGVSIAALVLVGLLSLSGIAASVLGGLRLADYSRQVWEERARIEALAHSTAIDGALLQVEAQLRALATLFYSSEYVDDRELAQAEANLPSEGLSITLTGLVFASVIDDSQRSATETEFGFPFTVPGEPGTRSPMTLSHFPVVLPSTTYPQFHIGADLAAVAALRSMALSADRLRRQVIMSPTFELDGRQVVGFAMSAPNGKTQGLLLGLLALDDLFERVMRSDRPSLHMRLLEYPGSWEFDGMPRVVRGMAELPTDSLVTFDHRFTHGEARWNLQWSVRPGFQGGVDTVPALLVGVGGSLLSLLVGLALCLLIYQNALIRRRVEDRTAELSEALHRAEVGNRAKTNFLAVIGHELRTPLNAVIGFADLLENLQPSDVSRNYVHFVQGGGRHLLRLVNALLEVAQAEAGELTLAESEIGIRDLVEEAVHALDPALVLSTVAIDLDLADDLPTVRGDRERLMLVVVNLLLNAIRAAGDAGRVVVRAVRLPDTGWVRLLLSDSGPGMTDDQLQASLRLFEQVENPMNRRHEGLGIGLPLCRHLVHLHGGILAIDTKPGTGTTVTVDLPAAGAVRSPRP
ncbi:HAMP domain-containing sensor histidine kinase [Thalassobaculum sp. OXR-137]|uniref:sensor histidine kinase n=1 Tax=Thalassobaculum sp. OXR-137 TaxID=3100173 RepID=UPI002AC920FF|nr:HAMP domain-containing sensor histidine kinase [Thalassobaculum sp. OXR-137]WPZ34994.1 HAMP domain-containing sensor histidine kinase [Thalassobaculum sp. OXR-137]